jgi:hypothetical protein
MDKLPKPKPTGVRLPDELRKWLKHQSIDNHRSLNSEIIFRLEESQRNQAEKEATHAH